MIQATLAMVVGPAVALVVLDRLGWRITSGRFGRDRLVTGTR